MAIAHVARDGTIVIPADVTAELGLHEGDSLGIEVVGTAGKIILQDGRSVVSRTAGVLREYVKNGPTDLEDLDDWLERSIAQEVSESMREDTP